MIGFDTCRPARARASDDAGFSLLEVLVAMALGAIFMTIFTAGMLAMYRGANKAETISVSQSQIHIAFLRVENKIRYAAEISEPGQVGGDWYVEYRQVTANGATCGELRLRTAAGLLQQREWTEGATPGSFLTLAANVSSARPFELMQGSPTAEDAGAKQFQQLKLGLTVSSGPGGTRTLKEMSVAFTALNAPREVAGADACSQQGRAAP